MGLLDRFTKRITKLPNTGIPHQEQTESIRSGKSYVCLSTALDGNVCPMCAQFDGKFFTRNDAPKLPLCPTCRCGYMMYIEEQNLPPDAVISRKSDFVLPAPCTSKLAKNHDMIWKEKDIHKQLQLCEAGLELLPQFMKPYLSAGFPAPNDLACRDKAPELYMRLGDWDSALRVIQFCMAANAYYPESGEKELLYLRQYSETATTALVFLTDNPGILQRDIYKKLCPPADLDMLKHFTRYSLQIRKEPYKNTNKLFIAGTE